MNILYLNHYAGSPEHGMEFRPFYMAKEWTIAGHNVKLLAADYSHVRANQPISGSKKYAENIDGIDYVWYPTPKYSGNGFGRVKNIASFLWQVWKDARKIAAEFKPNVVIASSTYPLDIWVAKKLAKLANAKLVFEIHDLWPLSPIELGGMSPWHPFIVLCQMAENYAYKNADIVVSMLPKVHEHTSNHGLDLKKLTIIPNGIVEEDWELPQQKLGKELDSFLTKKQADGYIIVGYAGAHGRPNTLETLLNAAKLLAEKKYIFVLVGNGLEKENLIAKKTALKQHNVFFFDPISKNSIPSLLHRFDIAYIGLLAEPLFRFGISPNKLMDYMMAAKPIICAIKAGNDPVTDCQCGITVEPGDPDAIAQGINKLASLSSAERSQMGQKGKDYILKNQTYKVLAKKFLDVMQ